jgi:hypothetical protein
MRRLIIAAVLSIGAMLVAISPALAGTIGPTP